MVHITIKYMINDNDNSNNNSSFSEDELWNAPGKVEVE